MKTKPKALLLSKKEMAEVLSCTENHVWHMWKSGKLPPPAIEDARYVRWDIDTIREWIKNYKKKGE